MQIVDKLIKNVEQVIVGKTESIRLAVTCLVAGGHLLIEDIPGTGKTTLALALARSINAKFSRIQFTPDLLPTDVTGISIFNQEKKAFEFRPGPIFHNIILGDEINRGTPRVQSGLLEAMNEGQVSVDGITHPLPHPFLVIATQNPQSFAGTYPLLTAQLDRFLMKISLGYLNAEQEIEMLKEQRVSHPIKNLAPVLNPDDILELQKKAREITVDESIYKYIVAIVNETRNSQEIQFGISHRGTLALFNSVRAYAVVHGRNYVLPDDVKALTIPTLAHRIVHTANRHEQDFSERILKKILKTLPVPL